MLKVEDINHVINQPGLFEKRLSGEYHPPVVVVNQKGELKKAEVFVYGVRSLQEINIAGKYFAEGQGFRVLKIDHLSEHKFIPLIYKTSDWHYDIFSNPQIYHQSVEILKNNPANAVLFDESMFYLNTCYLIYFIN